MDSCITILNKDRSKIKAKKWGVIVFYVLMIGIFYILGLANISFGAYTPFAFGLYFALCWAGYNKYYLSLTYIIGNTLAGFSLIDLYISLNVALVGVVISFIHDKIHKKTPKLLMCLYAALGNICYVIFNTTSVTSGVACGISLLLGILFLYASMHFLESTILRGFNFKLNLDEIICGCIMLAVLCMGFANTNIYGVEPVKIFAVYCVLVSTYLFTNNCSLLLSVVMGLGVALSTNNVGCLASFASFALVARAFKTNNKVFSCLGILLMEVVFGLYFKVYEHFTVFSLVSVIIAELAFMLTPMKVLQNLSDVLGGHKDKVAIRNIVNRSKEGICKRMNEISTVFMEMDGVYRNMVQGVLPVPEAKKMLTSELIEKCCRDCKDRNKCLRVNGKYTTEVFNDFVNAGFEKGKANLLDVPSYLTSKCGRVNYLLSTMNQLLSSYKHYAVMVNNMDTSKVLIADQLNGISSILKNLSDEVKLNISFDLSKENRIIEELGYKSIYCLEAIVYEQNANYKNATLVVKASDNKTEIIEKTVSKIVGNQMRVVSCENSTISGAIVLTLKTVPNYDIVFGSSTCGKTGEFASGDTHSLIKIDEGKYMVALCDGMGSGEKANKTSNLAISLIENFYKAGFDNEIILSSVNRLLTLSNEENFSALDLCVLDLRKNICDFIKLGSPYGFIKHKNSTEVIETSGLPIGVLEEMKPHITKKVIEDFDIVVLVSDGVTDAFGSKEDLLDFINNISSVNPQTISDEIVDRVMDIGNGVCKDDVTVVAVRIFPVNK